MGNHKLHQIETDHDPENDTSRDGGPQVTWAEKALFDEVLRLMERVTTLESKALLSRDEDHLPALFEQIYRSWNTKPDVLSVALPNSKYKIGQIVATVDDNDGERQLSVISGKMVYYLDHTGRHHWEYHLSDRQSKCGWYDEEQIIDTAPQTEDEKWWITGGGVPIRPTITCWHCGLPRIDDSLDCPYCFADIDEPDRSIEHDRK